jgi:hypothetical protein
MVKLVNGGIALIKVIDEAPHGNNLKNYSQTNGPGTQKWRKCIEFKIN